MFIGNTGNILGFIAALLYFLTLTPSIIRVVLPKYFNLKFSRFLLKYRREIGVYAWVIALAHGIFIVYDRNLNLLDLNVAKNFIQGLLLITIFSILAVTSNHKSQKILKQNWKRLHRITYLGLIILPWHIIDKMSSKWSIWTIISLIMIIVLIIFSLLRVRIYYRKKPSIQRLSAPKK